jgi:RimJ/RimL family protein N-acetyltransferase
MHFESQTITTKKNKKVTLRMLKESEAQAVIDAMVDVAIDAPYLLTTADDFRNMNVEDEINWIRSYNENPRAILIAVEYENKICGILDFKANSSVKFSHRGGLGISLHSKLRGEGVGEFLFKKLITESKKIEGLLMLELSVMSDNHQAYHLYKKVGFIETGRKPMAYRQPNGQFQDEVQMMMKLQ